MAAERRARVAVSRPVLEYAMQHPGQTLLVSDIAAATGLNERQVRSAIRQMSETDAAGLWEVAIRGNAWVYHPRAELAKEGTRAPEPAPQPEGDWILVEVIGSLKNGGSLVRTQDGSVSILKPLDIQL